MLHLRRVHPSRAVAAILPLMSGVWDRMVASDPGLLRLGMAWRGTAAVFLTTLAAIAVADLLDVPPVEFASGITFSLMATFLTREPTRRQRQRTLVILALPAAAASVATTLLHGHGPIGDSFFIVLVFLSFLLQARDPRAIGLGLVAVVISYIGLYLDRAGAAGHLVCLVRAVAATPGGHAAPHRAGGAGPRGDRVARCR